MSLIRWQPWQEMETARRQLDQLFEEWAPIAREGLTSTLAGGTRVPAIELATTETDVILKVEIPGISAKDLDVQVGREAVSIRGEYQSETKEETEQIYRSEFRYGSFHRVIPLPLEIKNEEAKAEFKDGVLTLTLPKADLDRAKVVKLKLGEETPAETPAVEAAQG